MGGTADVGGRGWLRATGLMVATVGLAVVNPGVLAAVPFALLVVVLPPRRPLSLVLAALGILIVAGGDPSSGLWYVERGWALLVGGCFLAFSLRWPDGRFLARGLGAVFGAFVGAALIFGVRPGDWLVVDWAVRSRLDSAASAFLQAVHSSFGPDALPAGFEERALETMAAQSFLFPALMGLSSLSALGLAWWLFQKASRSSRDGLGRLRDFRFNDQLVWVLILGVITLLLSTGAVERIGINTVFFMGALYALRGLAVVLTILGGLSVLGSVLFVLGFFVLAPLYLVGALFIGLGDTWFDLRKPRTSPRPGA